MAHLASCVAGRVVPSSEFENLYPVDASTFSGGGAAAAYGFSTTDSDSVFYDGSKDAIIRSIHVGYSDDVPLAEIHIYRQSDNLLVYKLNCVRSSPHSAIFGPDGIRIAGGFYIQTVQGEGGGGTPLFAVAWDVV